MDKLIEGELTYKIRGFLFNVYNSYGGGLKEIIYKKAIAEELDKAGIGYAKEQPIKIYSLITGKVLGKYIPDFIVEDRLIIEVKAREYLVNNDIQQQRGYLKAGIYEVALLVNFSMEKIDIRRSIFSNANKPFSRLMKNESAHPELSVHPHKSVKNPPNRLSGFTLIEILIVIAILGLLAVALMMVLDPKRQMDKAWDTQRRHDIRNLDRIFNENMVNKQRFPAPQEACFDAPVDEGDGFCYCHICGLAHNGLSELFPVLNCDPQHGRKEYLYEYPCAEADNLNRFLMCANLTTTNIPGVSYNFGWAEGGIDPQRCNMLNDPAVQPVTIIGGSTPVGPTPAPTFPPCPPDPVAKWCIKSGCNNCGTFANCQGAGSCSPSQLYSDSGCSQECQ